jgi:hypothetical protein
MIFYRVPFRGPDRQHYEVQVTGQIVVRSKLIDPDDELTSRQTGSEAIEQQIDKAAAGLAERLKRDFFTPKEPS